jgi:hypothetical protein
MNILGLKIKYWVGKSLEFLLLLLFLGYYGSITLFPHSHIVNGVTIVHSHPYNPVKGSGSSNPEHTGKELMLIQLLSELFVTAVTISFATLILSFFLFKIEVISTADGYAEPGGYRNYSLRAPPF